MRLILNPINLPKSTHTATRLLTPYKQTQFLRPTIQHLHHPSQYHQQLIRTMHLQGRCVCNRLQYSLDLSSPEDARTTLCHCSSCRRAFGTNYGLTAKVPLESFRYDSGSPKKHKQENGVTREFCDGCGAFICEYGVCLSWERGRRVEWVKGGC